MKKLRNEDVWNRLLKFVSFRPRSEKEVSEWLQKKKVGKAIKYIKRLKGVELLDDKKFAEWFVESRMRSRPRSKRFMIYELRIKGIAKEISDEVMEESGLDEVEMAKRLVEKNSFRWVGLEEKKRKEKIRLFLERQGFVYDIISF